MALDQDTGTFITLSDAQEYVTEFRRQYPDLPKGFFAGKNNIDRILAQKDCIGIRMYNGYDDKESAPNMVIIGVDINQKDMTDGLILEKLGKCPPECDSSSRLS